MKNGDGTLTRPDGYKYVGDWKEDKKHGLGFELKPNGEKFVCESTYIILSCNKSVIWT